jgi:hypothetical protein
MTKDIADLMKSNLSDLNGSDKIISTLAGLTRVFEYKGTDNELKKLAYPLDCTQLEPNCQECEELFILVPDQSKRCIVYFEGGASSPVQNMEGATKYQTTISLVCWYNLQGFTATSNLQSRLIALFSDRCKNITTFYQANQSITGISVEVLRVQDSDPSIFSKYTYSQDKSQYLGCPFSSFKIDFKVNFTLYENPICFDGIVVTDIPVCC